MSPAAAQEFWKGQRLRNKHSGEIGKVTKVEDCGGDNQRITLEFDSCTTSSVKLPGWEIRELIDYEIVFRKG